jgi:DNA polymerase
MEALKLGLKEEELMPLVKAWRAANSNIEKFWGDVEKAAMASVRKKTVVSLQEGLEFSTEDGILFIRLPSGRRLAYAKAAVITSASGFKSKLTYEGLNQDTKQWVRLSTYGGKLVENIVQATARDCLAEAMLRLEEAGYKIVLHCHDEVVLEVPNGFGSLEEVQDIMATPISWAKGLPLRAEAFESGYYRK